MNIGIVTVYKNDNYGAFWQAYALKSFLEGRGHQVFFVKHNARNLNKNYIRNIIKATISGSIEKERIKFLTINNIVFKNATRTFAECSVKDAHSFHLIILGSDEIWNVKRKKIYKYPVFSGLGFPNTVVSYAPAVNRATPNDFLKHVAFQSSIQKLYAISVRDHYSKTVVEEITGRTDIVEATDPTLLMPISFYNKKIVPFQLDMPYILVYSYGDHLLPDTVHELCTLATSKKLTLVSILSWFNWCNINKSVSPFEMLSLFQNATLIATDTFHGLMFSLLFQKQFLIISDGTPKLQNALRDFNIQERYHLSDLETQLIQKIDYRHVNDSIESRRASSIVFLDRILSLTAELYSSDQSCGHNKAINNER